MYEIINNIDADRFSEVSANPDVEEVNHCAKTIRKSGNDVIIAVGGGSVIDAAKAASVTVNDIAKYHGTGRSVPETHIPLIAVPTTSGTGSEVTNTSVLTNRRTGEKAPIVSDSFYPKLALIDPMLTISMPKSVTASTGIDVLCHAVESYWSRRHLPVCEPLAVKAARLVLDHLARVYENPYDTDARERMSEASLLAGLAFSLPKTTSSHACSYPLTALYGIPHGEACGLTLDYFIKVNAKDERTRNLSSELGFSSVNEFADAVVRLKKAVGLRTNLRDFTLSEKDIDELVRKSHHPNMLNNPIEITDEILYDLYHKLR